MGIDSLTVLLKEPKLVPPKTLIEIAGLMV
jgi:hypothetical protein